MRFNNRIVITGSRTDCALNHIGDVLGELGDIRVTPRHELTNALTADMILITDDDECLETLTQCRRVAGDSHPPLVVVLSGNNRPRRLECYKRGASDVINVDDDYIELYVRLLNHVQSRHHSRRHEIERIELGIEILRRSDLLHETRLEITRLLGRAAEYRDNETGRHVVRVSKISELVCRALGLRPRETKLITQASPLHDIGKIGIPDAILLKPGRLDQAELRIMRRHTIIGAKILASSNDPLLYTAKEVALNHHEHWNGGGYPRHLRGDRIPMSAQVVSICDVFDALTSKRPYKPAWTFSDAIDYLHEQAGSQFSPHVCSAFIEVSRDVTDVATRYADDEYPADT